MCSRPYLDPFVELSSSKQVCGLKKKKNIRQTPAKAILDSALSLVNE